MYITIIGFRDWQHAEEHGINVRDLHLAVGLANSSLVDGVLFINRPVSLAESVFTGKNWRHEEGNIVLSNSVMYLTSIDDRGCLSVLSIRSWAVLRPFFFKRNWIPASYRSIQFRSGLNKALAVLGFTKDVLLIFDPFALELMADFDYELKVHDVIDNFVKHNRYSKSERGSVKRLYKQAKQQADIVTCVSDSAAEIFRGGNCDVEIFRNGVNESWLAQAPEVPIEYRPDRRAIGFGGYITNKLDIDALAYIASELQGIDVFVLGHCYDKHILSLLSRIPNVFYLGFKRYRDLPNYYFHLDVGLILYDPKKLHDEDPLKLYEYLSLGVPVVSLPLTGDSGFSSEYVYFNSDIDSIVARIKHYLSLDREGLRHACRSQLDSRHFWGSISDEYARIFAGKIGVD